MTTLTAAKDQYLAELGGLLISTAAGEYPAQFPDGDDWQEIVAVPGLFLKPLRIPNGGYSDYFTTIGAVGTHAEQASVPQSSQLTVLSGAMRWQQARQDAEYRRLAAGDTVWLDSYEEHSFVFLADCVCLVVITPPLAHHTPRP